MTVDAKIDEMLNDALVGLKEITVFQANFCECTPIEKLMTGAFLAKQIHTSNWLSVKLLNAKAGQFSIEKLKKFPAFSFGAWQVNICPQVPVGPYRVDFIAFASIKDNEDNETHRVFLAIECDGHEFHEKTKEQAERDKARDRYLTGLHIPVMRFTGREIWRDPMRCAEEVVSYFEELIVPALEVA